MNYLLSSPIYYVSLDSIITHRYLVHRIWILLMRVHESVYLYFSFFCTLLFLLDCSFLCNPYHNRNISQAGGIFFTDQHTKSFSCIFCRENTKLHLLQAHGLVQVLGWRACCPGLSPTENIWLIMKCKITQRRPRIVEPLVSCNRQEWDNMPLTKLQQLLFSVPRCRCHQIGVGLVIFLKCSLSKFDVFPCSVVNEILV